MKKFVKAILSILMCAVMLIAFPDVKSKADTSLDDGDAIKPYIDENGKDDF